MSGIYSGEHLPRQQEAKRLRCDDCGLLYSGGNWPLDVTLSDEQWLAIHPEGMGGVLCPDCICRRGRVHGASVLTARLDLPAILPAYREVSRLAEHCKHDAEIVHVYMAGVLRDQVERDLRETSVFLQKHIERYEKIVAELGPAKVRAVNRAIELERALMQSARTIRQLEKVVTEKDAILGRLQVLMEKWEQAEDWQSFGPTPADCAKQLAVALRVAE